MNRLSVWPLTAAIVLLAGCAIPPRAQHPDLSAAAPLGGVGTSADAAWPDATWWHRYHDEQLNDLEARALQNAPTLAAARARFDLAARNADIARADSGATVNGISSTPGQVSAITEKYAPVIESMEGAALHYVCVMENIPFIQIRSVSNFAGERNKENWKIMDAIKQLNTLLKTILEDQLAYGKGTSEMNQSL